MKFLITLTVFFLFVTALPQAVIAVGEVPTYSPDQISDDTFIEPGLNEDGTLKKGFVPCSGNGCSACDFVVMTNTIVKWLVGISFLFFAVLAVIAGFKMVTSGSPNSLKEAKQSFSNAFIGLIIIFAAWLLVDTLMHQLLKNGDGTIEGYGPWAQIQCGSQAASDTLANYFAGDPEIEALYTNYDAVTRNSGNCQPAASGACSASALSSTFGNLATNAATILSAESGCNPTRESGTDRTSNDKSYSIGLWQINIAVHSLSCNGQNLNCPSAFRYTGTRHPKYKTKVYEITNPTLYAQCVALAKDATCNSTKAAALVQKAGNFRDWACSAKKCGISTPINNKCPVPSIK